MDRTTQIITLLAMLCISLTASAQHGKKQKGIQAYPVYYLQGLEFEQDSSVIGLYDWIKPEDRMAVLQEDSKVVALIMDTLISLPAMEFMPIAEIDSLMIENKNLIADSALMYQKMALDSIYYYDDYYDFEPDWDGVDSVEIDGRYELTIDSLSTDSIALDPLRTDTLSTVIIPNGSLIDSTEVALGTDSLSGSLDSLEVDALVSDSMHVMTELVVDSLPMDGAAEKIDSLEFDSFALPVDTLTQDILPLDILQADSTAIQVELDSLIPVIEPIELDSLIAPTPMDIEVPPIDTTAIELGKSNGAILIKSDPTLLGENSISRPRLDTDFNRRGIMDRSTETTPAEVPKSIASRVDTVIVIERIIEQAPTEVIERVVEKQSEYTGEYAGLPQAQRERQLRIDAESRRTAEAARVKMEKANLEADLSADERVKQARSAQIAAEAALALALANQAKEKEAQTEAPASSITSATTSSTQVKAVAIPVTEIVVQRDTVTEKVVAQLAARLDEQAAKTEKQREADNQKIEGRFDRIETKMDTLLNALGKKVVMNEAKYSIPQEEMNIYFAINSHTISARSLVDLESYLGQLKNMTDYRIVLSGYADSSGNLEYNKLLVSKRIASVKDAILSMGIAPTELLVNNYGNQKANATKTFNQLDRKVAIQIFSAE